MIELKRSLTFVFTVITLLGFLSACCKKGFSPVNVGREYGNPTMPLVVSHLPKSNQWALDRTGPHSVFRKILCFDCACRRMIGRRKALHTITFEKFQRQIKKNARKGVYKKPKPAIRNVKSDTVRILPPSEPIAVNTTTNLAPPVLKADSLIILNEFLFETDKYKLKEEQLSALDSIGKFLKTHPTLEVIISGHTDNIGNERHNVILSSRRAEVVAAYLIDKGAVTDQVSYVGLGSTRPITGNDTEKSRSKNRRVEILIRNPVKK